MGISRLRMKNLKVGCGLLLGAELLGCLLGGISLYVVDAFTRDSHFAALVATAVFLVVGVLAFLYSIVYLLTLQPRPEPIPEFLQKPAEVAAWYFSFGAAFGLHGGAFGELLEAGPWVTVLSLVGSAAFGAIVAFDLLRRMRGVQRRWQISNRSPSHVAPGS